ncbi:hypothetical protein Tco_0623266 [Tanacetum coccineum]
MTAKHTMELKKPLSRMKDGEEVDVHTYRSMIGSLMYLTSSRPDIMFAVSYTYSDYAGASLDRKSTTEGCQFLRCRLISWQCKKQTVVANSITKVEYVDASSAVRQLYLIVLGKAKKSVRLNIEKLFGMELELILFWSTVKAKTINGEVQLHAIVDGKKIIVTESTVRRDLQLEDAEDEDITLVNIQDDANNEIFDVDALTGDEVFAEQEVAAKDVNLTVDEVTLAQALAALKSVKPKVKRDVIKELNVPVNAASAPTKDKGKGIMIEEPVKPKKKDVQIMLDEEAAKKLLVEFDEEERLARDKDGANVALTEEWDDI